VETALVLTLDDADPFDAIRRHFAVGQVARGIPFHITLLYPFAPREQLSDSLIGNVRSFFADQEPFEFTMERIETFPPAVVYAAPEPAGPLRDCTYAIHARFPDWPPYEGAFAEVIPHATLGEGIDAGNVRREIERRLAGELPRSYSIDCATLLEEFEPDRWRERERFPLGG
jgi:2'-5' RNA ligase